MPLYKDNANNRRLKRVGMGYGKECSPCEPKSKSDSKPTPAPKPVKKAPAPKPVKKAPAPKPVKKASDKKPKKAFKTPKKGEIFSDNIKTPVKKAPAPKPVKKAPAPAPAPAPKPAPASKPAPVPKKAPAVATGVYEGWFSTVKNPKDISSSTIIKKQLKQDLQVARQQGLYGKDLKESKKITKKFIIWVDGRESYNNDQLKIIKNYDKLPKNMKDNVTLLFHKSFGVKPEVEKELKKLNLTPFEDPSLYFGFYNP